MHREYHRWDSPSLGRPMELVWYGHYGRPILAFPTSLGTAFQNEDCGLIEGLRGKIDAGEIQVCCVDAIDGEAWYNQGAPPEWKLRRYLDYTRYLETEVFPLIRSKARRDDVVVYGASFGAYHAMNFAGRFPHLVSRVVCLSGLYDVQRFLHGWWSDDCYFNCPTAYYPNLSGDALDRLRHIGFVVATGEHDHLVGENRHFAGMLAGLGLNVYCEIWPGVFGHDWPFWRDNLARLVP